MLGARCTNARSCLASTTSTMFGAKARGTTCTATLHQTIDGQRLRLCTTTLNPCMDSLRSAKSF